MKALPICIAVLGIVVMLRAPPNPGPQVRDVGVPLGLAFSPEAVAPAPPADGLGNPHGLVNSDGLVAPGMPAEALTAVVQRYCVMCHNDQLREGNLSLQSFEIAEAVPLAETAEKIIHKLGLEMMPPPGMPRPGGDTLQLLVATLEEALDRTAADPIPASAGSSG